MVTASHLALATALLGCDDYKRIHGVSVTLSHPPEVEVCAGSVSHLDDAYREIARFMGLASERRKRVTYTLTKLPPCDEDAQGCAADDGRRVWGMGVAISHELVHALQHQLTGTPVFPFLSEGLSVALGGPEAITLAGEYHHDIKAQLEGERSSLHYDTAGDFTSYLLTAYGFDRFERLLRSAPRDMSASEAIETLEQTYGKKLDALVEDRWSSGLFFPQARLGLPQCTTEPKPWRNQEWATHVALHCASPQAIGPVARLRKQEVVAYESFDIATEGTYLVELEGRAVVANLANPCSPTEVPAVSPHLVGIEGRRLAVLSLAAGRYFVELRAAYEPDAEPPAWPEATLTLSPYSDDGEATCPPPVDVDASTTGLNLLAHLGERAALRFAPRLPTRATFVWTGLLAPELCTGPCAALECQPLATLPFDPETLETTVELTAEPYLLRYRQVSGSGHGWARVELGGAPLTPDLSP